MTSRSFTTTLAIVCLFNVLAVAAPAAYADDREIAQALRAGDLVDVVRHGATFADHADTDPLTIDNIAAQRNLNDKSTTLTKAFGDALRHAQLPVGSAN